MSSLRSAASRLSSRLWAPTTRRSDAAVSEIIGYMLAFALSSVILVLSLRSFVTARDSSNAIVTGVELKGVADRISTRIVQEAVISQAFPNATINLTTHVDPTFAGQYYTMTATKFSTYANTSGQGAVYATGNSTNYKIDALPNIKVEGVVGSSNEWVVVSYEHTRWVGPSGAAAAEWRHLRIHQVNN
ncbi:MAG: hypothetical protein ACYDCK_09925 [Thermoplasmatota archaeon]